MMFAYVHVPPDGACLRSFTLFGSFVGAVRVSFVYAGLHFSFLCSVFTRCLERWCLGWSRVPPRLRPVAVAFLLHDLPFTRTFVRIYLVRYLLPLVTVPGAVYPLPLCGCVSIACLTLVLFVFGLDSVCVLMRSLPFADVRFICVTSLMFFVASVFDASLLVVLRFGSVLFSFVILFCLAFSVQSVDLFVGSAGCSFVAFVAVHRLFTFDSFVALFAFLYGFAFSHYIHKRVAVYICCNDAFVTLLAFNAARLPTFLLPVYRWFACLYADITLCAVLRFLTLRTVYHHCCTFVRAGFFGCGLLRFQRFSRACNIYFVPRCSAYLSRCVALVTLVVRFALLWSLLSRRARLPLVLPCVGCRLPFVASSSAFSPTGVALTAFV